MTLMPSGLYKLDNVDLDIIKVLTDDSSLSTKDIAKFSKHNIKIVREHLGMLKEYGIIEKYTIDVAWNKVEET